MKEFFNFKLLITPQLVKILHVLLLLMVLFYTWTILPISFFGGFSIIRLLFVLFVFFIGIIGVRIVCELVMVLFRINDNLEGIRDAKETGNDN